jgi:hypothetical protein
MHKAAMPNYALSSHGLVRLTICAPLLNGPSTLALTRALPVTFLDRYCNVSVIPSGFYRNSLWVSMTIARRSSVAILCRPPFGLYVRESYSVSLFASCLDRIYRPPCICYSGLLSASVKAIDSFSFFGTYFQPSVN